MRIARRALAACFLLLACTSFAAVAEEHPGVEAFADKVARDKGIPRQQVLDLLASAKTRQDILDAMKRPAESKPWYQYRPIFLTPERIGQGIAFWDDHEKTLARAAEKYGVDPSVIVAILGVETRYGKITGRYRVLDALATLAFHYPPRASFFQGELEEYLVLGREEHLPLGETMGSYAGAMGFGQFIPSSYREYAVDFDGDGQRNLWSVDDAIGSVANYFARHGWERGGPVAVRAKAAPSARPPANAGLKPAFSLAEMARRGFSPERKVEAGEPVTLITLEQPDGPEYWLGFENFYVISRYNHSPLYAMAVHQLGRAIMEARDYKAADASQ